MSSPQVAPPLAEEVINAVVAEHDEPTGDVLGILESLQKQHPNRYLPMETLSVVAGKVGVSKARVYSVVTFYSFFNLQPQGKNTVMVCRGTACHTRGAKQIHAAIVRSEELGLHAEGEDYKTADNELTVRNVACFGQCALAPVVAVNERIYSDVTTVEAIDIVKAVLDGDAD